MSVSRQDKLNEQNELLGRLCNEDLDAEGRGRLNDSLTGDVAAQQDYVRYLDLQAMIRLHAQSLDDEDFALLEAQAALDALHAVAGDDSIQLSNSKRETKMMSFGRLMEAAQHRLAWTAAAVMLLVAFALASRAPQRDETVLPKVAAAEEAARAAAPVAVANLRGTVGARWAGARLELPEGEAFTARQRIELVEGLAEVCFGGGSRVVLQGPAIVEIQSENSIGVSVGRIAAVVPHEAGEFKVQTAAADLSGDGNEYGAEVDVDGSLVTQVYLGEVSVDVHRGAKTPALQLSLGQGAQVDATSGRTTLLPQPNELHFVRYLPHRETRINLAEVVAGGDATAKAYHRGLSLSTGAAVDDYGAPVVGDGKYKTTHNVEFVDGVFIPNGKQVPAQVDSIGRTFAGFPATAGDCWGGAIMARRPRYESSLPLIRLEFHGNNYGYVNWLHIASKPDELSPQGLGLIGMHSNCGITFDLHAIRARYPDKRVLRFRAQLGNLESRLEGVDESHTAEAWVLVDGELRHHRQSFSRENGVESIDIPLADRDRFLVLAVTDDGGDTAYDWVAFGDAVIELTNVDAITDHQSPVPNVGGADLGDETAAPGDGELGERSAAVGMPGRVAFRGEALVLAANR
ncbi:MAG: NPCBM/NEW2 domain-containing protein [Pirellulales bacterium]